MTRSTLSAAYQAEVVKGAVRVAEFLELAFPSGTIRVTTADRDIVWGEHTDSGTYARSGTTITVSIAAHGLSVGQSVTLDFTTGGGSDGLYIVVTAPDADTFTVTDVVSGTTSGNVSMTYDLTWSANALMRDYGGVSESSDNKPRRIALKLSGINTTLLTRIRNDAYHYARVQVYLGFFNEAWALLADPYAFGDELLMSSSTFTQSQGDAVVELSAETWDIFGERDSAVLATPESQKLRYAGDTGMDRVALMTTQEIEWGGGTRRVGWPGLSRGPEDQTNTQ